MNWFVGLIKGAHKIAMKHAPGILMGMGTVGLGTALVLSIKAGPKAVILTEQAEMEKARGEQPAEDGKQALMVPLTWQEKLGATYKLYIPPVGIAIFSLMCFWAAHGIDLKRQAVVAGLYSTAEATLQEYQRKGWAVKEAERWHFTPSGFLLSNLLIVPLTIHYVNPTRYGIWITFSNWSTNSIS